MLGLLGSILVVGGASDEQNAEVCDMSDEVKVTVLPPGRAVGAGDLQAWALRRSAGEWGVPETKKEKRKNSLRGWRKSMRKRGVKLKRFTKPQDA